MCRYVRKKDRTMNKQNYPKLFYPEIYILHGGYKVMVQSLQYSQIYDWVVSSVYHLKWKSWTNLDGFLVDLVKK